MKRIGSLLLLLAIFPVSLSASYYFSSSSGDDSNPCTRVAPCKTIDKLNSLTLSPGDHVYLKRGDVWHGESLWTSESGTAENPIVIDAYGVGDPPRLDGVKYFNASDWTHYDGCVWKANIPRPAHNGADGQLLLYDVLMLPRSSVSELDDPTEYYVDTAAHEVYVCVDDVDEDGTIENPIAEWGEGSIGEIVTDYLIRYAAGGGHEEYVHYRNLELVRSQKGLVYAYKDTPGRMYENLLLWNGVEKESYGPSFAGQGLYGFYLYDDGDSPVTISNCTVTGNGSGPAIYIYNSNGEAGHVIKNTLVFANLSYGVSSSDSDSDGTYAYKLEGQNHFFANYVAYRGGPFRRPDPLSSIGDFYPTVPSDAITSAWVTTPVEIALDKAPFECVATLTTDDIAPYDTGSANHEGWELIAKYARKWFLPHDGAAYGYGAESPYTDDQRQWLAKLASWGMSFSIHGFTHHHLGADTYSDIAAFDISYIGSGTTATMTITTTTNADGATVADRLQTHVDGSLDLDLALTEENFPTLQDLIDYIDGLPDYECSLGADARWLDNVYVLAAVSEQDITSTYAEKCDLEALRYQAGIVWRTYDDHGLWPRSFANSFTFPYNNASSGAVKALLHYGMVQTKGAGLTNSRYKCDASDHVYWQADTGFYPVANGYVVARKGLYPDVESGWSELPADEIARKTAYEYALHGAFDGTIFDVMGHLYESDFDGDGTHDEDEVRFMLLTEKYLCGMCRCLSQEQLKEYLEQFYHVRVTDECGLTMTYYYRPPRRTSIAHAIPAAGGADADSAVGGTTTDATGRPPVGKRAIGALEER